MTLENAHQHHAPSASDPKPPATLRKETSAQRKFLETLLVELFQTERAAIAHLQREAARYGATPPGQALLAIAEHGTVELPRLEQLSTIDEHRMAKLGAAVEEVLSTVRGAVTDRVVSLEKSYRSTLLGLQQGLLLASLVRYLAKEMGKDELASWCKQWVTGRKILVDAAQRELVWFAQNPAAASSTPSDGLLPGMAGKV